MHTISAAQSFSGAQQMLDISSAAKPTDENLEVKATFQDFVAGTFYKQMLKAMRETHGQPAYFHGGAAEETFRGQLDQQIAEDMAKEHGAAISDPLFNSFSLRFKTG